MGRKRNQKQVECKYEFDRLGKQKMEKVYDILLLKVLADSKKSRNELELVHGGTKQ
jgi:hypothetical protein